MGSQHFIVDRDAVVLCDELCIFLAVMMVIFLRVCVCLVDEVKVTLTDVIGIKIEWGRIAMRGGHRHQVALNSVEATTMLSRYLSCGKFLVVCVSLCGV